MKTVSLTINGKKITAKQGEKVLWAALDNGIYIPNLCAIRDASEPHASCRLCFVEIKGQDRSVTACTEHVVDGMIVNTQGAKAQRLARTSLELLLASHTVDCANCSSNKSCELQKIAAHLRVKLKTKRFRKIERNLPVDDSCPLFTYDPNKCVLCGKCVWVCQERLDLCGIGFAHRGFQRVVTTFADEPIAQSRCQACGKCVAVCPVGALSFKDGEGIGIGE
ncbi:2Fe-2S iron-sulfur cluster-binding protein [Chloroflexota bacterium]